ncbi:family 43 glycosylhydrolase [Virgibacillus salexigens]|uniref:family 43 glycosylhydrolase n=1 Tax=Virgibacillus salexigens TaxID=61016 RepID=UPI00190D3E12|nr:family 43 glycosylhydrolase [Virgibacillus salexigens]
MIVKDIHPVRLSSTVGNKPELPPKVNVSLDEGQVVEIKVDWEHVDTWKYQQKGEFEVKGKLSYKQYPRPLIEQRADPYIYLNHDGYYYFTGSHPLYDRIVLRRAKKIEDLPKVKEATVWEKHQSGIMSEHIWAPEIHYINGRWYIYFAAGDKDDVWAIRPYVLENTSTNPLEGKWVEKGQINTEFQSFSLDATTFEHQGIRYLVWAQKVNNDTISNLYIAKMENPWTITGEQVLLATPDYSWEQAGFEVNEGPAVLKRNGRIFIAYSASATDDRYAIGLLTADETSNLLDEKAWTKTAKPVFISNKKQKQYGPGHNSFTTDETGDDLLVYHARPYKQISGNPLYDHNRHARVQPLLWKSDGTPYFGVPGDVLKGKQEAVAKVEVI